MNPAAATLFGHLDHELWLITAAAQGRRGGLIATFVSQASLPANWPRLLVGLARQHHTWELVQAGGVFAAHLLAEEQIDRVWRFGLQSGRDADKFADLTVQAGITGCPLLPDAPGWLECRVEASLDTGDRTIFLGEVVDARWHGQASLLTTRRMLQFAPPEKLQLLQEQVAHDSAVDAAAIRVWRERRALTPDPSPSRGEGSTGAGAKPP
jgi:flavin reductase (DIM6/NTAB) family NADH-FMN oxidoreductase RutF